MYDRDEQWPVYAHQPPRPDSLYGVSKVFGEALAAKGAAVQRPLWASTSTKNPAYRDVLYVEELVGPDTVIAPGMSAQPPPSTEYWPPYVVATLVV